MTATNPSSPDTISGGLSGISGWLHNLTISQRRAITGYLFISPFILGFFLFFVIPALTAVYLVFHRWNLIADPEFVAFRNIEYLVDDSLFWQSLKVTSIYTFVSVPLGLIFSFMLALLINTKIRGIAIFRTIYYLPSIVPAVANAVLWAWIFNTEFGLLNVVLRGIGLTRVKWLQEPEWALVALIIMSLWGVGSAMIVFLAGLQGIPDIYYEAAEIDGAGRWAKLRFITIPVMSPVIFFNLIMGIIGSFQVFTAGFLITDGGPQNGTLFLVLYIYRNAFEYLNMGYAAVLSWVLFGIIALFTFLIFRYYGRQVYYENV
ncbi:MAG: sugar ABC transporter permease [Anaerolineae bacterium]|nr:sugar ABC transporter permease [Anaerolineae bacterium]